jgi:transketolase
MHVLRPADANETAAAWLVALKTKKSPSTLVLSRQKLPVLEGTAELAWRGVERGAYVLADADGGAPRVILIATGSEVELAVGARKILQGEGVPTRVVSMPSWELFAAQDAAWRESVLPRSVTARVAVEAGSSFGWERWVGTRGRVVAIDRFGASAPGEVNLERLGFTVEHVVAAARAVAGT